MKVMIGDIATEDVWADVYKKFTTNIHNEVFGLHMTIFYDKSHMDLHGNLSLLPFMCVPSIFNQ